MYDKAMDEPKPAPHELTRWIEGAFLEELEAHRAGLADLVRTRLVERRPAVAHLVQNDLDALRDYVEDELSKIKQSVNQNEWRTDEQLASLNWRLNSVETDLEDLKPE